MKLRYLLWALAGLSAGLVSVLLLMNVVFPTFENVGDGPCCPPGTRGNVHLVVSGWDRGALPSGAELMFWIVGTDGTGGGLGTDLANADFENELLPGTYRAFVPAEPCTVCGDDLDGPVRCEAPMEVHAAGETVDVEVTFTADGSCTIRTHA